MYIYGSTVGDLTQPLSAQNESISVTSIGIGEIGSHTVKTCTGQGVVAQVGARQIAEITDGTGDHIAPPRAISRSVTVFDYTACKQLLSIVQKSSPEVSCQPVSASDGLNASDCMLSTKKEGIRRARTVFKHDQKVFLENEFKFDRSLKRSRQDAIASKLQLTSKVVRTWFQNRRAKEKKGSKFVGLSTSADETRRKARVNLDQNTINGLEINFKPNQSMDSSKAGKIAHLYSIADKSTDMDCFVDEMMRVKADYNQPKAVPTCHFSSSTNSLNPASLAQLHQSTGNLTEKTAFIGNQGDNGKQDEASEIARKLNGESISAVSLPVMPMPELFDMFDPASGAEEAGGEFTSGLTQEAIDADTAPHTMTATHNYEDLMAFFGLDV